MARRIADRRLVPLFWPDAGKRGYWPRHLVSILRHGTQ